MTDEISEADFRKRFVEALESAVSTTEGDALATHGWRVAEMNKTVNLTRITSPEDMARRHALDSLAARPLIEAVKPNRVVDVGTGAGWPGLALAIACPTLPFTLLDSTRKKITVVQSIVDELDLGSRVECRWARFEAMDARELNDALVIARAVGPIDRLVGWLPKKARCAMLLWKGPALDSELDAARSRLVSAHLRVTERVPYRIPDDPASRELALLRPANRRRE